MNFSLKLKNLLKSMGLFKPVKKTVNFALGFSKKREIGPEGWVDLPKTAIVELTLKCNLNCQMCLQKQERALGKKDLDLKELRKLLDNLGSEVKYLSLIGGEVFCRPDIFEILKECQKRGIKVRLTTNASLLGPAQIKELKRFKKNISGLGISLDGLKNTHDQIRGVRGTFDRSIKAISLLLDDFTINVNCVLFKENLGEIIELVDLLKKIGLRNFSFQPEMFSTASEVQASAKLLGLSENDFKLQPAQTSDYNFSYEELKTLLKNLNQVKGIDLMVQPTLFNKYPNLYYKGSLRNNLGLACKDLFMPRINAQGNLIFCSMIKKELGSLVKRSLKELWNRKEVRELRLKLLRSNLTPICKRCCRLGLRK